MFRRSKTDRSEPENVRRAREAAESASAERIKIESSEPEAEAIGSYIRDALKRNHFGEAIERSWALRRGPT